MKQILALCFVMTALLGPAVSAQEFKISAIDIFGNRKTDAEKIHAAVGIKAGDSINPANFKTEEIVARLRAIPGIKHATINPIMTTGNIWLFAGIGESDTSLAKYRDAPVQEICLPDEMLNAYRNYMKQHSAMIQKGGEKEDDAEGYALVSYAPAREEQLKYLKFAARELPLLANVLKNCALTEHRVAAAAIVAYSPERKKVAEYLLYAMDDPDEIVRNNAARALGILAKYAYKHPDQKIAIPATPFIQLLNSISFTDRNKGSFALQELTEGRDPALLNEIRQQALPSIIEMAKWKSSAFAFSAYIILGRMAGLPDKDYKEYEKISAENRVHEVDAMLEKCCRSAVGKPARS